MMKFLKNNKNHVKKFQENNKKSEKVKIKILNKGEIFGILDLINNNKRKYYTKILSEECIITEITKKNLLENFKITEDIKL